MQTPCVQICVIDQENQLCRGCGRTLDEIGSWSGYGDDVRNQIMERLASRLNALQSKTGSPAE